MEQLRIVGRDAELADVRAFATGTTSGGAGQDAVGLLIAGEPGLGKTTVWAAGVTAARESGASVLVAQPAENDARRSFAGLADLLRGLAEEVAELPVPQRRGLDVALLRAEPTAADDSAIGPALLGVLNRLASRGPVLIAIDDLQWLDASSADALAFAVRRLDGDRVRLLLARRAGTITEFERDLRGVPTRRIDLAPLSLGAIRRLILDRLGIELPRRRLRELHGHTGGNPLYALELAAFGFEEGDGRDGASSPPPAALDEVLGARLAGLPASMREVLLAVALAPAPTPSELVALFGQAAIREAVEAGLLASGEQARVAHPLLASVALGQSSRQARRQLHAALAAVIEDEERRLRHLASAAAEPDAALAAALDLAGDRAAARGAAEDAADLAGEALRLTPDRDEARELRLVTLAERLVLSGDHVRGVEVLLQGLEEMTPGPARARARLVLAEARFHVGRSRVPVINADLDAALADAPGDDRLLAMVLARRSHHLSVGRVESLREAEADGRRALELSLGTWPDAAAEAAHALAWARHLRGRDTEELRRTTVAAGAGGSNIFRGLERIGAENLLTRGRVAEARRAFERLLAQADERGEMSSFVAVRLQLTELELRAGRWDRAAGLLDEWIETPERMLSTEAAYERCRALLASGRGDAADAKRWADSAVQHSEERGLIWDHLESLRASGLAALLGGRPGRAAEALTAVWTHTRRAGVLNPGAFPVAPDLVEALVETGDLAKARFIARSLIRFGRRCEHPWAAATGRRSLALVDLVAGDPSATARSWAAAVALRDLGLSFDEARTLFALGRALRRMRQWGEARRALAAAKTAFEALGSSGWAELAAGDLERIGGRRPAVTGTLTATEERVARLAADGLSNKEIAQALAVSVDTVERHLSHGYAKLGVQSRSQLGRRLPASPGD